MNVQPYLLFNGHCEEAINYYQTHLDAQVLMMMRFSDSPEPECCPPGRENLVMHATLQIGASIVMMSDGQEDAALNYDGFSLSLSMTDMAEAEARFNALSQAGEVICPLAETFWSPGFGMVKDPYGITWMINVEAPEQSAE